MFYVQGVYCDETSNHVSISVMDTSDNVIETYSVEALKDIVKNNSISILGFDASSGNIEITVFSFSPEVVELAFTVHTHISNVVMSYDKLFISNLMFNSSEPSLYKVAGEGCSRRVSAVLESNVNLDKKVLLMLKLNFSSSYLKTANSKLSHNGKVWFVVSELCREINSKKLRGLI